MEDKLKNWKKVENKKYFKCFWKENASINIWVFSNDKKNWLVDLDTGEELKKFKSESQAIKFVKSYMKKHD